MTGHKELCDRLRVLSDAVTRGESGMREFDMRIPPEPNRDADFVLSNAADLIEQQAARIAELEQSTEFSKRRFDQLSAAQANMRGPERTMVCDILANGFLLSPPTPHDRYTIKPDARIAELESPTPRPLDDWFEGDAVWFTWRDGRWLGEPSWIGTPLDSDWPGYHTHWIPHPPFPKEPKP